MLLFGYFQVIHIMHDRSFLTKQKSWDFREWIKLWHSGFFKILNYGNKKKYWTKNEDRKMKGRVWYTHIHYTCIMKPMQFAEHMQITIDTGYFSCWWKFYIASDQFLWKIYYPILRIFLWETWNVIDIKDYKLLIYTNGCNFHVFEIWGSYWE